MYVLLQNTSTYFLKKVDIRSAAKIRSSLRGTQYIFFPVLIQFTNPSYPGRKMTNKKCQKLCYANALWDSIKQIQNHLCFEKIQ